MKLKLNLCGVIRLCAKPRSLILFEQCLGFRTHLVCVQIFIRSEADYSDLSPNELARKLLQASIALLINPDAR